MLFQCWPTVSDAGPTLKQHWETICNYAAYSHELLYSCQVEPMRRSEKLTDVLSALQSQMTVST